MLKGRRESQGAKGWIVFHSQVESQSLLNVVKFMEDLELQGKKEINGRKLILQIRNLEERQWENRKKTPGFVRLI